MGAWALWNLILSIAGAVLALMMGIRVLMKKRQNRDDEANQEYAGDYRSEEEQKEKRGRLILIFAIPILAIIAIIIFILTQDMRLPMIMVDWWTLAHLLLFVAGVLCYIFAYKRERDEDDDEGEPVRVYNNGNNGKHNRRVLSGNK